MYFIKSPVEGVSWPCSPSKYPIVATKDDAGVPKENAGPAREEFLNKVRGFPPGRRKLNRFNKEG